MREKKNKTRILFLCTYNACRSQMAEGFARARKEPGLEIASAGTHAATVSENAIRVMAEAGIDISGQESRALNELASLDFDVVIALCMESAEACPVLPGNPEVVAWNLPDPGEGTASGENDLDQYRSVRDEIKRLVDDLFDRGYLAALTGAKRCSELILNNISEGIIAHDMNRYIFYFNKAAEEMTGYSSEEVVGRDCREVFPGGFCGGKCKFMHGERPAEDKYRYENQIVTKGGEERVVDMTIRKMRDHEDREVGVLSSFLDVTRERRLSRRLGEITSFSGIVGRDHKMLEIFDLIQELADSTASVLINGESGTGKELVAAAIHNEGPRAGNLFVPVNCGALPESLLESELFGHVKGAFTGAVRDKKGRFELADGGTIFLDEIGDISQATQARLLRVLQEGKFERLGDEKTIQVNVRVISATNKDLTQEIRDGRFRSDLFYRLNVVPIDLPPLRQRPTDIPLLAEHILNRTMEETGRQGVTISSEAMDVMMSYTWPGNVRELENWINFALIKCKEGVIQPRHLPHHSGEETQSRGPGLTKPKRRKKLDVASVRSAMNQADGNKVKAAKILGVSRATLYRFLEKVGEDPEE